MYHKSEYDQLSHAQKSELAKARRNVSGANSVPNSTIDTRNIYSAVTESIREIMADGTALQNVPNNQDNNQNDDQSSAKMKKE